ncbi:MAG: type II toxin-antitoxin system HipA family toxin [Lachnospiraceae bacterium]|nr:type II toxin-antitoxin system HipA family toxin [Lachnospiraceae bacterium]
MRTGKLDVFYDDRLVGSLVESKDRRIAFEYSDLWINEGFSISPRSLPLEKRVFIPTGYTFGGLFGVFSDSLPDAWGRLLLDRMLKKNGINPDDISELDRLAIIGEGGMGALCYKPSIKLKYELYDDLSVDLDELSYSCQEVLKSKDTDNLDYLYKYGGSSGGARPKVTITYDDEEWLVKFPSHLDNKNIGFIEYEYNECAKYCGINVAEHRLFKSNNCKGYFGSKRFDKKKSPDGVKRHHMLTASAILEADFRTPCLDYNDLIKLTRILSIDNKTEVENIFRLMCFNVFAHNRDDHAKNFTYIYDDKKDIWLMSPAYDLTYSTTYYGEHTTSINGNGKNPTLEDIVSVAKSNNIDTEKAGEIAEEISLKVNERLNKFIK